MVRGNWQKRVESAEARRQEAKQRKQKSEDKRLVKTWVQEWLATLDDSGPVLVHLWTTVGDRIRDEEDANHIKRRPRSGSMNERKKKAHPRSKQAHPSPGASTGETVDDDPLEPPLCRSFFFTGKCDDSKSKKASCRYVHYPKQYLTLASVLDSETCRVCESQFLEDDDVPMLYYTVVHSTGNLAEAVKNHFATQEIPLSSLVYAVVDRSLVFDRYQDGRIHQERRPRQESISLLDEEIHLTGPLLEHILSFLPDSAVAMASQVCQSWHQEIGSPRLWQSLLERRGWPVPDDGAYRDAFVRYYSVHRDVEALVAGIHDLSSTHRSSTTEYALQDFLRTPNAPNGIGNTAKAVRVWSPNRALAAYREDCTLRLFESVPSGGDLRCKEIALYSVDPYRKTKRMWCRLQDMDLDEDCVGCVCQVSQLRVVSSILVIVRRDDLLMSADDDDDELEVIDVGEAVLNYLLSSDVADHTVLQLVDFLQDGGEVGEIDVLASETIAACGYGRFLVEVSITIPDTVGGGLPRVFIGRKLVMFSSGVGAIVWMGDSFGEEVGPNEPTIPARVQINKLRLSVPSSSRKSCRYVVGEALQPAHLILGEIEASGEMVSSSRLPVQAEMIDELYDWELMESPWVDPTLFGDHEVVVGSLWKNNLRNADHERSRSVYELGLNFKSMISFMPTVTGPAETLDLPYFSIFRMIRFHGDFLLALGSNHRRFIDPADNLLTAVILVHIPARKVISRHSVGLTPSTIDDEESFYAFHMDCVGGTVAVALGLNGVIMTGSDVRGVCDEPTTDPSTPKSDKKKGKRNKRSGKKDGFARGMSLRG